MAFFLRFRAQLRRTRPALIPFMEDAAAGAIKKAGGKIIGEQSLIRAVFEGNSLGFWVDILILIETIIQAAKEAAPDLYGYSLVLWKDNFDIPESLCRLLAGDRKGGGIFLDREAAESLRPYVIFENEVERAGENSFIEKKYGVEPFSRLKDIKIFVPMANTKFSLRDKFPLPAGDIYFSVLVIGRSLGGRRDDLYRSGGGEAGGTVNAGGSIDVDSGFPPLFIRFGNGGLNAVTDSWTEQMQNLVYSEGFTVDWNKVDEIRAAWKFLFRRRLMDTLSLFTVKTAGRFFNLLLDLYISVAKQAGKVPEIIIENIHIAEKDAADIVIETLQKRRLPRGRDEFRLFGICAEDADAENIQAVLKEWKPLFPGQFRAGGEAPRPRIQDLPPDIWEIGYACLLLGRYFPPDIFPVLFEEAGKSPEMISRSLSLLYALKIIDTPLDPRPWNEDFGTRAEISLGEKKQEIFSLVRERLLAWVESKKINPCFRLLAALTDLGENSRGKAEIDDSLILQSILRELDNGTDIQDPDNKKILTAAAGLKRSRIINFILETLPALYSGNVEKIRAAFSVPPDCDAYPVIKAQVLINKTLYSLGIRDNASATDSVKEAILLCQKTGGPYLARSYLLFALANLSKLRIGEIINYTEFAFENAVKSGGPQDIGMVSYYSSVIQFLFGNLSLSQSMAQRARLNFLEAGNPEWADRARFFEGRLVFEQGSYLQALKLFEDIRDNPSGVMFAEKENLLATWAYRAAVCCGQKPVPGGNGFDTDLFNLEDLCLNGEWQKAVEFSSGPVNPPGRDTFYCTERPDWRSGFMQCELLCFSRADIWDRIAGANRALALSQTGGSNSNEAVHTIQNILRGGRSPDIDTFDIFFYYVWYRVLQNTGASQVDISTAVSIGFKRLQSRAGRIDDSETRRLYLNQPYYNKALAQAAKEFKIV